MCDDNESGRSFLSVSIILSTLLQAFVVVHNHVMFVSQLLILIRYRVDSTSLSKHANTTGDIFLTTLVRLLHGLATFKFFDRACFHCDFST